MNQQKSYLKRFNFLERIYLNNLLRTIHFSYSNSLKLLAYVYEIKRRENFSVKEILQKIDVVNIINNSDYQGKKKTELVLNKLFTLRNPLTSQYIKDKKLIL